MPSSAIVLLPLKLSPNGNPAVAALIQRDNQSLAAGQVYIGRNYAFTGAPPASYTPLAAVTKFAMHGVLSSDFLAAAPLTTPDNALPAQADDWPTPFPLTEGMLVTLDGVDTKLPDVSDFDAICALG